jgi:protoporphyrinogen oxidase
MRIWIWMLLGAVLGQVAQVADLQASWAYPITVVGGAESSFKSDLNIAPTLIPQKYDVVIVGSGLAGLAAAVYLTDHGKHVLILEKEDHLGGLASSGSTRSGIRYDRGAAYWTDAYLEESKILERIGLGDFMKKLPISEPADSLLIPDPSTGKNRLHMGIWETDEECLKLQAPYKGTALEGKYDCGLSSLSADFALFQYELVKANEAGLIGDQPIEEQKLDLDAYNAAEWIRAMPARIALRKEPEAQKIYQRFLNDSRIAKADPMSNVIGLMNLYCRSALGTTSEFVSALAFANFYISEITTRYATQTGTNGATVNMEKILTARPKLAKAMTSSLVTKMKNTPGGATVTYQQGDQLFEVHSNFAIYAGAVKFAPKLIEGLTEASPEQAKIMNEMEYSHYSVHNVFLKGHPYRTTYDTWTLPSDATLEDFTDIILGRWMDPKINGYAGMRGFKKDPSDDEGIMTIYHPLPASYVGTGYTDQVAIQVAQHAVDRMLELFTPIMKDGNTFDIESVETSRWPFSVHIAKPGHFTHEARLLRQGFEQIFFANNNLGTPAFEEALFRGHCAADNILIRSVKGFQRESWSRCPIDR